MRLNLQKAYKAWKSGKEYGRDGDSISTNGHTIFSYHTALVSDTEELHTVLFNGTKYSHTTTGQQSSLRMLLKRDAFTILTVWNVPQCERYLDKYEPSDYPETYLFVENLKSGDVFIQTIQPNWKMHLETRIKYWLKNDYGDEYRYDGKSVMGGGDFYAAIKTDHNPPRSVKVWEACCFYVEPKK